MITIIITFISTIILCIFVAYMLSRKWRANKIILTRDVLRTIFQIVGKPQSETNLMRIMARLKKPKEKHPSKNK